MNNKNKIFYALSALVLLMHSKMAMASVDETVNEAFSWATGWFVGLIFAPLPGTSFPWIVLWLVIGASVFTLYFGFIQFRAVGHSIALVKGEYTNPGMPVR
ncbi:hypothetical protein [Aliamphritea spongicola]|nr:hypothetical protein [Aliamphritea spongicola]